MENSISWHTRTPLSLWDSTPVFSLHLSSQVPALSASSSKRREKHKAWTPLAEAQSAPRRCQGACWSPRHAEKWPQSPARAQHWPFHLRSVPRLLGLAGRLDSLAVERCELARRRHSARQHENHSTKMPLCQYSVCTYSLSIYNICSEWKSQFTSSRGFSGAHKRYFGMKF